MKNLGIFRGKYYIEKHRMCIYNLYCGTILAILIHKMQSTFKIADFIFIFHSTVSKTRKMKQKEYILFEATLL